MVNSNVPRYSNLASELHRNYLFKFTLVLFQFDQTRIWWLSCANRLETCSFFQLQQVVKLYSFNPRWTMITTMFQEKSYMYHISEPIIRRIFPKTCATSFTFEQSSLIHSALQWNAATLCKVLAPFSFSYVIDSCFVFSLFLIFPFISWFFNKTIILLGLAGYQMIITNSALRTSLVIYHSISSAPS